MGIREEWLNDDECVTYKWAVKHWVEYIEYIKKNYPEIHKECEFKLGEQEWNFQVLKHLLKEQQKKNRIISLKDV